jgi:hypothetical protein
MRYEPVDDLGGDTTRGRARARTPVVEFPGMTEEFRRLAETATGQHGAVTTSQIRDAGITAGQLRSRVQSGILIRSGVHTYRDPMVDRSTLGDLRELVLDCGAETFVSGPTAAAMHGFDGIS